MKIIANKDFTLCGETYIKGDELTNLTYQQVVKLNEEGFIKSLTYQDLVLLKREIEHRKDKKEE